MEKDFWKGALHLHYTCRMQSRRLSDVWSLVSLWGDRGPLVLWLQLKIKVSAPCLKTLWWKWINTVSNAWIQLEYKHSFTAIGVCHPEEQGTEKQILNQSERECFGSRINCPSATIPTESREKGHPAYGSKVSRISLRTQQGVRYIQCTHILVGLLLHLTGCFFASERGQLLRGAGKGAATHWWGSINWCTVWGDRQLGGVCEILKCTSSVHL